jgi:membrane protease YdiL (CAAX protease family)
MKSSINPTWHPDPPVLRWAWVGITSLLVGASVGTLGFWLSSYNLAAAGLVLGLPIFLFSLVAFWRAVGRAQGIPRSSKRQIRRNILLFGPVAPLQLLVFYYFPNSSFSGLGGGADETMA